MTDIPYAPYYRRHPALAVTGPTFQTSELLTMTAEDWSDVRAPARARRRRQLGHRQRIRTITVPDPKLYSLLGGVIVGHPATIDRAIRGLADRMGERLSAVREAAFLDCISGGRDD